MLTLNKLKEEFSYPLPSQIPSLEASCQALIDGEEDTLSIVRDIWAFFVSDYKLSHSPTKFFFLLNKLNRRRASLSYEDILTLLPTSQDPLLLYKELIIGLELSFDDIRLHQEVTQEEE